MLFSKVHTEVKAGMKTHMENERKKHEAQLARVRARKVMEESRRAVAVSVK
jgi:hypothetical protein